MSCEAWPIIGYSPPVDVDPTIIEAATAAAQEFLSAAAGHRFGSCTYTQRFQVRQTATGLCEPSVSPDGSCCAITLPSGPVQSIVEVAVDGAAISLDGYTLLGGKRLARVGACWPQSGDLEPGRVEVTYVAGVPLVEGSRYYALAGAAMSEMVREYVEGMSGRPCKLPSRFTTVSRQGVTTTALDPSTFLRLGLTGMPFTDNFIRTVNPNGLRRRPRVVAIDGPRRN